MRHLLWATMVVAGLTPLLAGMPWKQSSNGGQGAVGGPQARITNPHGPVATPCGDCHTFTSWKPIRSNPEFDHDHTRYPLRGMHEKVSCTKCHVSPIFKNVSTRCADCHADIHRRQFGANCESCHSVKGWQVSLKEISNHENRFPLIGAHALLQCDDCHQNAAAGQFLGLSTACYSCHQKDFHTPVLDHVSLGFPTTCESCHTMDGWFNAKFDHLKYTGYALTGVHISLACTSCHINNVFKATPATCYGCHASDFAGTNNPPHPQLGLPHDCSDCHSTTNWLNATFDHTLYAHYPLTGAHATVACAQCHVNNNYTSTPTVCYACHKVDFNGTTNPAHVTAGFPTNCTLCHTTSTWNTSTFNHASVFPLTGAHATVPCIQCHVNSNYTTLPTNCYGCHQPDWNGTANPNHIAAGFPTTCDTCHTTINWTNVNFNHALYANYPLTGAHATLTCAQCHINNNYTSTSTACYSCHQADFNGTTAPNHAVSGFPTDCSTCHTTIGWNPSTFSHNNTAFPLTGAHITVSCAQCHVNSNYTTLPTDCYGCHQADFAGTTNPNHINAGFPTTCTTCHNTSSWTNAAFNHNNTAFPLTGAHVTVPCAQCHVNNNYTTLPTTCYGCHRADFTGTTSPPHVASGFPTDCTLCHTTSNWTSSTFNHSAVFPLTGAHTTTACAQCHVNNNYTTLPTDCYGCHRADFTGTTSPNHITVNFPTTCAVCHNTSSWSPATFDHSKTAFPLTGAHLTVACAQCHVNNNYTTLPATCYGCHQADFTSTTSPAHVAAGFTTDCTLCHTTSNWTNSTFNHASVFPLTGAHATVACAQCHVNNNYTTLPTNCYGCHQSDFNGTTNPNHIAAAFPTTCDTCHSTTNWTNVNFNHATYANYPLTGAHATLTCVQCHINNNYTATSTACYSCHQADFNGTTSPNHVASGFPTDCSICHTTSGWNPSSFNHNNTAFPLTGAHTTLACTLCHTNNNFTTLPTNCYGCHTADWTGTTDPNHVAAGFPTTCNTCHTTTAWTGATFNHNNTPFPLTGAHVAVDCISCHINNVFAGTPTACYSCHQADFTGTTNPNHVTAGWPTTCTTCHTTTAWLPATLPASYHTFFPMTHGNANNICATCHTNSSDYSVFQCTGCHAASPTNSDHRGVSGYVYNSVNCYACHRNGRA